jgi:hypothetical protein
MPDNRSRWQDHWQRIALHRMLVFSLLLIGMAMDARAALWFDGGVAIALSWLGISWMMGLPIGRTAALAFSLLVTIASLVMSFGLGGNVRVSAGAVFVALCAAAWRFAPPRKPQSTI